MNGFGLRQAAFPDRKPDREGRSAPLPGARRLDGPPVQLDDVTDDREAKAEAAVGSRR